MKTLEKNKLLNQYSHLYVWLNNMPDDIWQECKLITVQNKEILIKQGNPVEYVYLICSGKILISKEYSSGNEKQIVFSHYGEVVGEMEVFLKKETVMYTAITYKKCTLISIPVTTFLKWTRQNSKIAETMLRVLAQKLLHASESTVQYQNERADERLARILSERRSGIVKDTKFSLAVACGVSERTIYRIISKFKDQNLINIVGGKIYLSCEQIEILKNF